MPPSAKEQLRALGATLGQLEATAEPSRKIKITDVPDGEEFCRIQSIPRREIPDCSAPSSIELADMLTCKYAKKVNPYPGALRPLQALTLREACLAGGCVGMLGLGAGKTLTSYLLPTVLNAKRPLYICPSSMKKPVRKEFAKFAKDWHGLPLHKYMLTNYELISNPNQGEELDEEGKVVKKALLERLAPDLLILDEAHYCADSGSTTANRIEAYLDKHPSTIVVVMTGTLFKTSIKNAAHLMYWALGENAPLPQEFQERELWASYLDVRKSAVRAGVGALMDMLSKSETVSYFKAKYDDEKRSIVRKAVSRRMFETLGVIGSQEPSTDLPLYIESFVPKWLDPKIEEAFKELRATWSLPDGTEFMDGLEFVRYADTMGLSFWNRMEPPPPAEWREARNFWAKWCRKMLKYNKRGIDSEAQMKKAVRKGLYDSEGALEKWEDERDKERERTGLQEPPSIAVWISDEIVRAVRQAIDEHGNIAIWTKSIGLGNRLARELGIPYYGEKGVDARANRHIDNHPGGPAVLSLAANGTGRNLQGLWHKNLWLCTPTEQALGRTHRPGQKADGVYNWILLGCAEHLKSFYHARSNKASFVEEMQGCPQRLRYAELKMPKMRELEKLGGTRWTIPED